MYICNREIHKGRQILDQPFTCFLLALYNPNIIRGYHKDSGPVLSISAELSKSAGFILSKPFKGLPQGFGSSTAQIYRCYMFQTLLHVASSGTQTQVLQRPVKGEWHRLFIKQSLAWVPLQRVHRHGTHPSTTADF